LLSNSGRRSGHDSSSATRRSIIGRHGSGRCYGDIGGRDNEAIAEFHLDIGDVTPGTAVAKDAVVVVKEPKMHPVTVVDTRQPWSQAEVESQMEARNNPSFRNNTFVDWLTCTLCACLCCKTRLIVSCLNTVDEE